MLHARNNQGQVCAFVGTAQSKDCWCLCITALCCSQATVQFTSCSCSPFSQVLCLYCAFPAQGEYVWCVMCPAHYINQPKYWGTYDLTATLDLERKDGFHSWPSMLLPCVSFIILHLLQDCSSPKKSACTSHEAYISHKNVCMHIG